MAHMAARIRPPTRPNTRRNANMRAKKTRSPGWSWSSGIRDANSCCCCAVRCRFIRVGAKRRTSIGPWLAARSESLWRPAAAHRALPAHSGRWCVMAHCRCRQPSPGRRGRAQLPAAASQSPPTTVGESTGYTAVNDKSDETEAVARAHAARHERGNSSSQVQRGDSEQEAHDIPSAS